MARVGILAQAVHHATDRGPAEVSIVHAERSYRRIDDLKFSAVRQVCDVV